MAAYAALLSVMRIIDNIQLHPHLPISLHKKQLHLLTEKLTFLQQFLESYNPNLGYSAEADPLESRIADAAYEAEDVIESYIVDHITNNEENKSSHALYEALEKVIEEMASIGEAATEIKGRVEVQRNSTPPDSLRSSAAQKSTMVGADEALLEMKDKLTSNCRRLQIIPIVGMGGTGKTTLALNIFQDSLIKERFDVCCWATISQEFSIREILKEILSQLNEGFDPNLSESALGEMLHKRLFGRRYLIVMDDMWSVHAWDGVRRVLPDNEDGSRVVVTTRLSNLASSLTNCERLEMSLLGEDDSWDLLSKTVFGERSCPPELEEIGKKIGKSCKGLPLSLVVIGGLLAKSQQTREFWEYIEENLNEIVNLDEGERCLKILHLSYKQLPVYLKPCFLYMGLFPEDEVILASRLTKLWIGEGFLKPATGKGLEETAKAYLKEVVDRNLVLIHKLGSTGSVKEIKIHDLLRDLCFREAKKERFYAPRRHSVIPSRTSSKEEPTDDILHSMSEARSLIWCLMERPPPSLNSRLLRLFQSTTDSFTCLENMLQLVNLRYIASRILNEDIFLSSIHRFWNLEILIVERGLREVSLPAEVWCMPQIRHVQFGLVHLPEPPSTGHDDDVVILRNLHTLANVSNFKCSEDVVKRILNIKKLGIHCEELDEESGLDNLGRLHKLESLYSFVGPQESPRFLDRLSFPHSLKKLNLETYTKGWLSVLEKAGDLPLLEKLVLNRVDFEEGKWETVEGQFRRLKHLEIARSNLVVWKMESSHFPCLEQLILRRLYSLEEIPLEVAEMPSLRLIYFVFNRTGALRSAKRIVEIQEEIYGEVAVQVVLRLKVAVLSTPSAMACRGIPNIRFE